MEEDRIEIRKVVMFEGINFNNWKFRTEVILKEYGIDGFLTKTIGEYDEAMEVDGEKAEARAERIKKMEVLEKKKRKCYSMLIQRIGDNYLEYVKDKNNPKEIWSALSEVYERKGVANRMFLRRKLLTYKMEKDDDLENHLLEFDKLVRDLKAAGAKIEDEDVVCQLLVSLSNSFESVSTALETLSADKLTLEFVKGRLRDANIKINSHNGQERQVSSSAFSTISRKNVTCFNCGQKGHYKNECLQYSGSSQNLEFNKCKIAAANVAVTKSDEEEVEIQF